MPLHMWTLPINRVNNNSEKPSVTIPSDFDRRFKMLFFPSPSCFCHPPKHVRHYDQEAILTLRRSRKNMWETVRHYISMSVFFLFFFVFFRGSCSSLRVDSRQRVVRTQTSQYRSPLIGWELWITTHSMATDGGCKPQPITSGLSKVVDSPTLRLFIWDPMIVRSEICVSS